MPKKSQSQNQAPSATTIKENKAFRDRLRDRYAPSDWVRVINIDHEPIEWQYFPIDGEEETFTDNGAVRVITGRQKFTGNYEQKMPGKEELWELGAGDSEVLLGACADIMIEALYKKMVVNKRVSEMPNIEKTQARSFNWNDGLLQEQMIDKIFLGVERPTFSEPATSGTGKAKQGA